MSRLPPLLESARHSGRPLVMGIVNVTPDSFSDGGLHADAQTACDHALRLVEAGADLLDLGGESTRPGASDVGLQQEMDRVLPVLERLRGATPVPLSVDTRKPEMAEAAAALGCDLWNDVSALGFSPQSPAVAARLGLPVVLMHAQGPPRSMQDAPSYHDAVGEVLGFLSRRMGQAVAAGLPFERILVDPGIGFGKDLAHNLALIAGLGRFRALGRPVLFGASRKRFIGALDGGAAADARLGGSLAAGLAAVRAGAAILRVHDVRETVQALTVDLAIRRGAG